MKNNKSQKPLIKLTLIVIPTIIVVAISLLLLESNGFFMALEDKLEGDWNRSRKGIYSGETYKESYSFSENGTGIKTYIYPDGHKSKSDFTWYITTNKTLVINDKVKYKWNSEYEEYYDEASDTAKKYWFVTKDTLYIGQSTSINCEVYNKKQ